MKKKSPTGLFFLASLCETDSPDTGEVALALEGERSPLAEGPRKCLICDTFLLPSAL